MATDEHRRRPDPDDWSESEARGLHGRLLALGLRVAAAESLSVGHVQAALGRIGGASAYFAGGVTCYTIPSKVRLLGVDAAHASEVNAVSARVAEEMARGVCRLFDADLGVATTGYAEPDPARGVTTSFAWVAVAVPVSAARRTPGADADAGAASDSVPTPLRVATARVDGGGLAREAMQARVATAALRLLAERLPVC